MLKGLPVSVIATAGVSVWFIYAFMSDNNIAWMTS
jgi:hypothetical protein